MPTYEYMCDECGNNFDVIQSMKDDTLVNCSVCGQDALRRVLHPVTLFCKQEAVTVAQQADRNVASMGHYEIQDKRQEIKEAGEKGRQGAGNKPRPKPERPFWRKTDKIDTSLAKLAPEVTIENGKITKSEPLSQKSMDYIMTGKKE